MARKGGNRKLKRLAAPRTWKIVRKDATWIIRPTPGPHSMESSIPLGVLLRDILGLAKTAKEVKYILKNGKVKVDGKVRKSPKFPVGFMDVVAIPTLDKYYRIVYDKLGRIDAIEITRDEARVKLVKVTNKNLVKGGKIQLGFHDGRTMLTEDNSIRTGDSLLISVPEQKIEKVVKLDKGNLSYITGGQHTGQTAEIVDIIPGTITRPTQVLLKRGEDQFLTKKDYVFVVGEKEPLIKLG